AYSIHQQPWPEVDEEATVEDKITLVVQINGKLRDRISLNPGFSDEQARSAALSSPVIQEALEGKTIKRVIVVPGKLVNVVV
ncbi:hypothetical protein, partial [Pseudomonas shirazica]|uniref:hypothetical protein n=1 Tax=Pseudomonas shirazica TaxID=1940636 RepID=UPI0015D5DD80